MVLTFSKARVQIVTLKVFTQQEHGAYLTAFVVVGCCGHCSRVFGALGCFHHFNEKKENKSRLTDEDIVNGHQKMEMDELRRCHLRGKSSLSLRSWIVNGNIV